MQTDNVFIEQAEYIAESDFKSWSSVHPLEDDIMRKLTQSGAKLLTGPRGCGKTTLMLKAFNQLLEKRTKKVMPIYVNFKSSLKLEPIYRKKANGGFWFAQWMYFKILDGLHKTLEKFESESFSDQFESLIKDMLDLSISEVMSNISQLELGEIDGVIGYDINVYKLEEIINTCLKLTNNNRSVLLLDDAAHAFSPEQQSDFFEFFRKVKSRNISPKAAIYPGVTNFSPTFHVGHDAEEVDAWVNPENEDYYAFMSGMLLKRLPKEVLKSFERDTGLLKVLCFSAFGIPRLLLNMVRNLYEEPTSSGSEYKIKFSKANVLKQVKASNNATMGIYSSLENKLPSYQRFVNEGARAYEEIISLIKTYNMNKPINRKSLVIAIRGDFGPDLKRILGFFEYSGLASYKSKLSKGEKGVFQLYLINIAALIDNNAIFASKNFKIEDLVNAIQTRSAHEYTRTQEAHIINTRELRLSLPECKSCGTQRLNEEAKFCHNCGAELKQASIFEALVNNDISDLPLTVTRIDTIKNNSNIRKIKDILFDFEHTELRNVPQVGEYWANKIYQLAQEYIS